MTIRRTLQYNIIILFDDDILNDYVNPVLIV